MRVLNYLECGSLLARSGISTAAAQQRTALSRIADAAFAVDLEVVTDPWRDPRCAFRGGAATWPIVDYDLAHCNAVGPGSIAVARHAIRTGRPLVLHAHVTRADFRDSFRGSNAISRPLGRYLRWFYSQADLVCCPSRATKRHLENESVDAPIEPITNGVDVASLKGYERLREPYRSRYGIDGDDPVVFAVGNVFERKGVSTFCRLARQLPYEFVWFGPYDRGPLASQAIRKWTQEPPDNVTFTGWIDDKRGAFGAGDVFCFPTRVENQGIAVLEAMACGKPVVIRDIPVFEEFYTDGKDCLKCTTDAEFRNAIERLAADPGLRRRLGRNARETAAEHDLETVGERLLELYRQVSVRSVDD
ncbi:glycosyltransferase family 4 protein [Halopiger djelfimassiliensis]|uniref:glycosyltransferase family 4 protein n=1 Tax=Halopiger djelfimassiliensis TaxID=1293047 RepID=UPI0006781DFE|nr:glycosyltransferase family 4 protein [Halopiger djelfimassiliensis]